MKRFFRILIVILMTASLALCAVSCRESEDNGHQSAGTDPQSFSSAEPSSEVGADDTAAPEQSSDPELRPVTPDRGIALAVDFNTAAQLIASLPVEGYDMNAQRDGSMSVLYDNYGNYTPRAMAFADGRLYVMDLDDSFLVCSADNSVERIGPFGLDPMFRNSFAVKDGMIVTTDAVVDINTGSVTRTKGIETSGGQLPMEQLFVRGGRVYCIRDEECFSIDPAAETEWKREPAPASFEDGGVIRTEDGCVMQAPEEHFAYLGSDDAGNHYLFSFAESAEGGIEREEIWKYDAQGTPVSYCELAPALDGLYASDCVVQVLGDGTVLVMTALREQLKVYSMTL